MQDGQRKWDELAAAVLPDGNMMHLYRRDHEYEILADGLLLMSNQAYGSEEALATIACEGLTGDRTVLVGGLGLGYTLRATLDMLDEHAVVVLAELLPAIVDWNRKMLGHLADHPLTDPRVRLAIGDVAQTIRDSVGQFDAMLLDVDNGPKAFTQSSNAALYGDKGLAEMYAALKPGGVLAIWSAWPDKKFEHRLKYAGFLTDVRTVPALAKRGGPPHTIFLGRRPSDDRGW